MERLLHYVWKHKLFPLKELTTTDGEVVEVIDVGLHNHDAGPDFFNAKVKIGDTLWVGNVEIHSKSSDWYMHGHAQDSAYDNVVLHIAEDVDKDVVASNGVRVRQMQLSVPQAIKDGYEELLSVDHYPPCYKIIPDLSNLLVHSWMAALQMERLEQKTRAIAERARLMNGSWEDAYFMTLARNYGFGINGDTFELWASHVGLSCVAHHRDDIFQIEALFMGQAGLLDIAAVPEKYREAALQDEYFVRMQNEYRYLAHKFSLVPMDYKQWRFLRLRPQNFPHIRLSQLATLYFERKAGLSALLGCESVDAIAEIMKTHVTPYWETHYAFGSESMPTTKFLSPFSINLLLINTAIPVLFAYGRHSMNDALCERAMLFLEQLKAENNHIVRMWKECGLTVQTAGDSQALIQLKKEYCDKKECLRCRIGYEYLKRSGNQ